MTNQFGVDMERYEDGLACPVCLRLLADAYFNFELCMDCGTALYFWSPPEAWPTAIEVSWRHEGERRQAAWDWARLATFTWDRAKDHPWKEATPAFKRWRNRLAARTQLPPRHGWELAEMDRLAAQRDAAEGARRCAMQLAREARAELAVLKGQP